MHNCFLFNPVPCAGNLHKVGNCNPPLSCAVSGSSQVYDHHGSTTQAQKAEQFLKGSTFHLATLGKPHLWPLRVQISFMWYGCPDWKCKSASAYVLE